MLAMLRKCYFALSPHMEITAINKVQSGLGTAALLQSHAVYCANLLQTISDLTIAILEHEFGVWRRSPFLIVLLVDNT